MSSANSPDWHMCRLRRETVMALRKLAESFEESRNRGQLRVGEGPGEYGWSVDQIVAVLVARELQHRVRSKQARHGQQLKRQAEASREGLPQKEEVSNG